MSHPALVDAPCCVLKIGAISTRSAMRAVVVDKETPQPSRLVGELRFCFQCFTAMLFGHAACWTAQMTCASSCLCTQRGQPSSGPDALGAGAPQ